MRTDNIKDTQLGFIRKMVISNYLYIFSEVWNKTNRPSSAFIIGIGGAKSKEREEQTTY